MRGNQLVSEENMQKFSSILTNKIHNGFTIIEKNDKLPFAILSKQGKHIDHGFNFLIFCFTLGLWSIGWIYLSRISKDQKILVAIDEDGNPFEEKCFVG